MQTLPGCTDVVRLDDGIFVAANAKDRDAARALLADEITVDVTSLTARAL
ncbi:hypothetical protein [uncultured Roseobacter sp.]|nr:hypothetical protein [uncultured Roseobacter sp.]